MDAWLTPTGEMEPMEASFWNDKRPNGVSNDIDLSQFGSILEVFDASCATHADRPAFTNMGVTLTWGGYRTLLCGLCRLYPEVHRSEAG